MCGIIVCLWVLKCGVNKILKKIEFELGEQNLLVELEKKLQSNNSIRTQ
jgi:hypothetical protein